jgi:sulfonate transport system substrate-binding protein
MAPWYDFTTAITDKDIKDLEETQDFLMANKMQQKKIDIKSIIATVK